MSTQIILSDLLVDLSTKQQQLLTGGQFVPPPSPRPTCSPGRGCNIEGIPRINN